MQMAQGHVVRASYHSIEAEGTFEIEGFPIACAMTTTLSLDKPLCREIASGPCVVAGKYQFGVAVVWSVNSSDMIYPDSQLGAYVQRLDKAEGPCALLSMTLCFHNETPSKNFTLDLCRSLTPKMGRNNRRGYSPSFEGAAQRLPRLTLHDLIDDAKGWLPNGVLKITCKVSVGATSGVCAPSCVGGLGAPQAAVGNPPAQELSDAMGSMWNSGLLSDVSIRVREEVMHAHSQILAARSPVFAAMFSSGMREGREREVVIDDLVPSAVREMLSFLYTGTIDKAQLSRDEEALALLEVAHRYEAVALVERCTLALGGRLEAQTVLDRLSVSDLIGCSCMKGKCLDFIKDHITEIQTTEAYTALAERRPALLMDIISAIAPAGKRPRSDRKDRRDKRRRREAGSGDAEGDVLR